MWKLAIEDDEGKQTVVPLTRDEYTIGRKDGNTIRLTERNVSREHAKVTRRTTPQRRKARPRSREDSTSYNGVYVNGLRVADKHALARPSLQIGDYRLFCQTRRSTRLHRPARSIARRLREADRAGGPRPRFARDGERALLERPNRLVVLAGPNPGDRVSRPSATD